MSYRIRSCLLAMLVSGLFALEASANGFRLADQDAFATARGEAFAATADNASAIYYNPAGLTQLEGNNVRLGAYGIYYDPTFRPPNSAANAGTTYHNDTRYGLAPHLFYALTPKAWPVSFGLGVYSPFGGSIRWPQNTGFRSVALDGALTNITINPVIAVKVLPSLSIAAGAMVNYGSMSSEQGLLRNENPFQNYFKFSGSGWSVGYNAGILWQPSKKISLGATFRSETTITMEGHTEFIQVPAIPNATAVTAQADYKFPLTAVFGVSYRPTTNWNVEVDADYTDWSSLGTITLHQTQAPPFPVQQDIPVNLHWQPSWMFELGATRYFDQWHVSAGYVFNQNSVPDTFYAPTAADMDRHFFSVGGGYKGKRYNFDLAYQFGYGPPHTVSGSSPSSQPGFNANQNADGTYEFISHAVILTVGIRF